MVCKTYLITLLIILYHSCCHGQIENLKFNKANFSGNGISNYVKDITQDSLGYLWIATSDGLFRYNGYTVDEFNSSLKKHTGLKNDNINELFVDSKRNLWVGTMQDGIFRFDYNTQIFIPYSIEDSLLNIVNSQIQCIFEDKNGYIWFGTTNGLNKLNTRNGKIVTFSVSENKYLPGEFDIVQFLEPNDSIFWIIRTNSIIAFNQRKDTFVGQVNIDLQQYYPIRAAVLDKNNNIWIGSEGYGLLYFNQESGKLKHYSHDNNNPKSISSNVIWKLFIDKKENLWIGTVNGGLNLFVPGKEEFIHFVSDSYKEHSPSSNSITALFQDNYDNIWIGYHANGIQYFNLRYAINYFNNNPSDPSSLSHNTVSSFYEDTRGNIWIGTDGGGLNLFDKKRNKFKHYTAKNGLGANSILDIEQTDSNTLWLASWDGGLINFNSKTRQSRNYLGSEKTSPQTISFTNLKGIMHSRDGYLWISTHGDGLNKLDIKNNLFYHRNNNPDNTDYTIPKWAVDTYQDSKNNIWVLTYAGLFRLSNSEFKSYNYNRYNPKSISSNIIFCVFEDSRYNLWVGTNNGLELYMPGTEEFKHFSMNYDLPKSIKGILEDGNKNLWISSNSGIYKFNPQTSEIKKINIDNGFHGDEFIERACMKASNGEMYFGGLNGFIMFHPDSIKTCAITPNIIIEKFEIFNKPVSTNSKFLDVDISQTKEIVLSYKENVISFAFTGLSYILPEKTQYAYKMENFDNEWQYVEHERKATYTNLNAGKYVFKVKAANSDNIWNDNYAEIKLTITPPFWKTTWFRLTALMLIIGSIAFINYYRLYQIKRRNKYLEQIVIERTKVISEKNYKLQSQTLELQEINTILEERQQQIEEQAEQLKASNNELADVNAVKDKLFSIIAHDLKNPFNTLMGFAELLFQNYKRYEDEKRLRMTKIIWDSSKNIYDLLMHLLSWSRSQMKNIQYEPAKNDIIALVNKNIDLIKSQADQKSIHLIRHITFPDLIFSFDLDLVDVVIRNLLTNAIKFTPVEGTIEIGCTSNNEEVIISIKDNGVGIQQENLKKLFKISEHFTTYGTNKEKGTGLGLILCYDFIKMHNGKIWAESTVGSGTSFFFSLPKDAG